MIDDERGRQFTRNVYGHSRIVTTIFACLGLAAVPASAWAAEPQVDTGLTSFMDGFGNPKGEGLAYNQVMRLADANSIKDSSGAEMTAFQNPHLDAFVDVNQFLYTIKTPENWAVEPILSLLVPLVYTTSSFGAGGASLQDNGFGLGDVVFGPFIQFKPNTIGQRPVFAQRFELNTQAPTGKYDPTKQINPGSNTWAFEPSWSGTLLPIPRLELTTRLSYLYNFQNDNPGGGLANTQSGQAIFDDFAVSFEVLPYDPTRTAAHSVRIGVNGYYFKQFTDDKSNGVSQPGSCEQVLALGPGAMWIATSNDVFWVNAYFETAVENRFASNIVQARWVRIF